MTGFDSGEPSSRSQIDNITMGEDREKFALPVLERFKPELRRSTILPDGERRLAMLGGLFVVNARAIIWHVPQMAR